MNDTFRQLLTGLRALLVLTVLLGIAYPVVVWGIGQTAFRSQADGSLVVRQGHVVGSTLIGQSFSGPQWFLPRPSTGGYDAQASGGSNLGPSEGRLLTQIASRRAAVAQREGVAPADVPADAVTASASGLDPNISSAYAAIQVARVARARSLSVQQVRALVRASTRGRTLGFLGEPRVNVLQLNLALDGSS